MEHPVLIADIDGVTANLGHVLMGRRNPYIPSAIEQLNQFCAETGAQVAPISARLRITSPEYFMTSMRNAGFTGQFYPGGAVPRSMRPFSRGNDLEKFLKQQNIPLKECVILDDSPRFYTHEQLTRLVRPDPHVGFSAANRQEATRLLSHRQQLVFSTSELAYVQPELLTPIVHFADETPWRLRIASPPDEQSHKK